MRSRCRVPGSAKAVSEQTPPMRARLADPAREEPRVAVRQRSLDLLERTALLGEREPERLPVVEEDVDPDPRVRARDPGHVPQGAAGRLERVVAVDPRRARVVEEHVCEDMREVARQPDEPVVRVGPDRDRSRAERADEAVEQPQPLGRRRGRRSEEPRRAVEELRRGAAGPARLGAADRVAADEALVRRGRRADRPLRRADVGDRRSLGRMTEDISHGLGEVADRRRDEHEFGVGDRGGEVVGRLDGAARRCERERLTVRIPARHGRHACATRGQTRPRRRSGPCRRRQAAVPAESSRVRPGPEIAGGDHAARINSATRKARSSDCRALSRGSQRVS